MRQLLLILTLFTLPLAAKEKKLSPSKAWRQQISVFKDKLDQFEGKKELVMRKYKAQLKANRNTFDQSKKEIDLQENNQISEMKTKKQSEISDIFKGAQNDKNLMLAKMQAQQFSILMSESKVKIESQQKKLELKRLRDEKKTMIIKEQAKEVLSLAKSMKVFEYPYPDLSQVPAPKAKKARRHKKNIKRLYKSYIKDSKRHFRKMSLMDHYAQSGQIRNQVEYAYDKKKLQNNTKALNEKEKLVTQYFEDIKKGNYKDQASWQKRSQELTLMLHEIESARRIEGKRLKKEGQIKIGQQQKELSNALNQKIDDFETKQLDRVSAN